MIRILLLGIVFAVVAPFFIKGPPDKALMSLHKWMAAPAGSRRVSKISARRIEQVLEQAAKQ